MHLLRAERLGAALRAALGERGRQRQAAVGRRDEGVKVRHL